MTNYGTKVDGSETVIPDSTLLQPGKIYRIEYQAGGILPNLPVNWEQDAIARVEVALADQYPGVIPRYISVDQNARIVSVDFEIPSGTPIAFVGIAIAIIVAAVAAVFIALLLYLTVLKVAEVNPSALGNFGFGSIAEIIKWSVIGAAALGGIYLVIKLAPAIIESFKSKPE